MEEKKNLSKKSIILIIIIVAVVVLLIGFAIGFNSDNSINTNENNTENSQQMDVDQSVKKNDGTISIPGYESLTLKADVCEQDVSLINPPQNNCYFIISLFLSDGTKLWESDMIEPGSTSAPIVLIKPISEGYYTDCILLYSCFSHDQSLKPLNGAETKLTLIVK